MAKRKPAVVKNQGEPLNKKAIVIQRPNVRQAQIELIGTSPLLLNRFSEREIAKIMKKQTGVHQHKNMRDVREEFEDAQYRIPGSCQTGIKIEAFRQAVISACRFTDGAKMTVLRGTFTILDPTEGHGLVPIDGDEPEIDERPVPIGKFPNKITTIRYRPIYRQWSVKLQVNFDTGLITAEQLFNLFFRAGFSVGVGEHRPEKGGTNGMFTVKVG